MQSYRLNFNYLIDSPLYNLEQLPPDQKQAYSKIIDSIVCRFNNLDFQTYDKAYSVIIDGHWGVGKSTLKNLIVNKLFNYKNHPGQMAKWGEHLFFWTQNYSKTSDDNFVWVEFNPWILGTSEDIILDFFKLLNTTLKKHYGSGLDINLKQFVSSISPTLTGLSQYTGFEFNFGGLARADSANHTFERLKERLSNIPQKIIISIDDIDRMEPETILTVIKLISITGNLPNLIFVLTLDYTIIEPILKEKLGDRYAHYLEKIIQAKYIVPLLTFDDKCYIITECLTQYYGWDGDNVNKAIDQVKNIVDKYPQSNPRQIKRLAFEVIHHCDLNSNTDKMEAFLDLDSKEFIKNYLDKQIHPTPLNDLPKTDLRFRHT
ncbi:MAG: hypothetical protein H7230_04730 [Candidatus Parcubacteria bacterium]|nr:hypothetical protein [Candidatus Paceibacterota bacterium]